MFGENRLVIIVFAMSVALWLMYTFSIYTGTEIVFLVSFIGLVVEIGAGFISAVNTFYVYGRVLTAEASYEDIMSMMNYTVYVLLGYMSAVLIFLTPQELPPFQVEIPVYLGHKLALLYMLLVPLLKIIADIRVASKLIMEDAPDENEEPSPVPI